MPIAPRSLTDKVTGFVFVDVEPGRDRQFIADVQDLDNVQEAHLITGNHDAFVIVEGDSVEAVHDWVRTDLRRIRSIADTDTFFSTEKNHSA